MKKDNVQKSRTSTYRSILFISTLVLVILFTATLFTVNVTAIKNQWKLFGFCNDIAMQQATYDYYRQAADSCIPDDDAATYASYNNPDNLLFSYNRNQAEIAKKKLVALEAELEHFVNTSKDPFVRNFRFQGEFDARNLLFTANSVLNLISVIFILYLYNKYITQFLDSVIAYIVMRRNVAICDNEETG